MFSLSTRTNSEKNIEKYHTRKSSQVYDILNLPYYFTSNSILFTAKIFFFTGQERFRLVELETVV